MTSEFVPTQSCLSATEVNTLRQSIIENELVYPVLSSSRLLVINYTRTVKSKKDKGYWVSAKMIRVSHKVSMSVSCCVCMSRKSYLYHCTTGWMGWECSLLPLANLPQHRTEETEKTKPPPLVAHHAKIRAIHSSSFKTSKTCFV